MFASLSRLFNIKGEEWGRVKTAWLLRFFYRTGFVIGWTVLLVLFVSNFGIAKLPVLFVLNAFFTMLGSMFFSTLLERFRLKSILLVLTVLSSVMLVVSSYFYERDLILFFGLLIATVSVLFMQLQMMINGFIEDLFSANSSERTFPFVESALTIGGAIGGVLIVILGDFYQPNQLILVWSMMNLLIIPVVLFAKSLHHQRKAAKKEVGVVTKLRKELKKPVIARYLKGLFLVVFFQWLLFVVLEFQYTQAVFHDVEHAIIDSSGFEHAFIESLGILSIIFSACALLMQWFFASRIIHYLGVVGSMMLHAAITLLSVVGMLLHFDFYTAVVAKNNFGISSVIKMNAYHTSYYVIHERMRGFVRELLEGFMRPIGALTGTLLIFGVEVFFGEAALAIGLNVVMLVAAIALLAVNFFQQRRYTDLAVHHLGKKESLEARLNAVDVLAQKGHDGSEETLKALLNDEKTPAKLRAKIAKTLAENEDLKAVGFSKVSAYYVAKKPKGSLN